MRVLTIISTSMLLLFTCATMAQEGGLIFNNYTVKDGLLSNECYCVFRDSKNYLWISSDEGVVRYDGKSFLAVDVPDPVVFKIREDAKGRIWFFSYSGVLAYFENGKVVNYSSSHKDQILPDHSITLNACFLENDAILVAGLYQNIIADEKGKLTVISNGNHSNDSSTVLEVVRVHSSGSSKYFVYQTQKSQNDKLLIRLTENGKSKNYLFKAELGSLGQYGAFSYNNRYIYIFYNKTLIQLDSNGDVKLKKYDNRILSAACGPGGEVWLGFQFGGSCVLQSNLSVTNNNKYLKDESVSGISFDFEGGIWFSTLNHGLFYVKSLVLTKISNRQMPSKAISQIAVDNNKSIYFTNEEGLYLLDSTTCKKVLGFNNSGVSDILFNGKSIYIATVLQNQGSLVRVHKQSLKNSVTYSNAYTFPSTARLATAPKNNILFVYGYTLNKLDYDSKYNVGRTNDFISYSLELSFKPTFVYANPQSDIWLGSPQKMYKFKDENFILNKLNSPLESFSEGAICMSELGDNLYAFGGKHTGLSIMKGEKMIRAFTTRDGLASNRINSIYKNENQLWLAGSKGVTILVFEDATFSKARIINLGTNIGLAGGKVSQVIKFGNHLIINTADGPLFVSNLNQFLEKPVLSLPLHLENIKYFNGDTVPVPKLKIPYQNSAVSIGFNAISYNAAQDIEYFYRILHNNTDTLWLPIAGNYLNIQDLSAGTSTVQMRAEIKAQQRKSDIQQIVFEVSVAWWSSWWAKTLATLIVLSSVYFTYHHQLTKAKKKAHNKAELQAKIHHLEQTALRSQLNPHFIFNCLSSIQQLILSGNSEDANKYLLKFSKLIRRTLDLSGSSFISIANEEKFLNEYLELESFRLNPTLHYTISIDSNIEKNIEFLPNMLIQPLVENSIKHGIKPLRKSNGIIKIEISKENDFLKITVEDNGVGRKSAEIAKRMADEQEGFGLSSVTKRIALLYPNITQEKSLQIKDLKNTEAGLTGTIVTVMLPVKAAEE